jgi:hypothetical protein
MNCLRTRRRSIRRIQSLNSKHMMPLSHTSLRSEERKSLLISKLKLKMCNQKSQRRRNHQLVTITKRSISFPFLIVCGPTKLNRISFPLFLFLEFLLATNL